MSNKSRVVIRERDEWSGLAEFLGNMIAKYAEKINFDFLPDPDAYLCNQEIRRMYKVYMKGKYSVRRKVDFVEIDIDLKLAI